MAALSVLTFALSWWLGLYLLARDPHKSVLVLAALGLCGFALVVALDAIRLTAGSPESLGRLEIFLVIEPGVAWLAVLLELARPSRRWRDRRGAWVSVAVVAAVAITGAALTEGVQPPIRFGHALMFSVISASTLIAMLYAVRRAPRPGSVIGVLVVATLFFALANAILVIPLGILPSWLALASTGFDILLLGLAVAIWDAFDEGQALRADMRRSFVGTMAVAVLFAAQGIVGVTLTEGRGRIVVTVLMFTSVGVAIAMTTLADPLAGLLDRLAFARSPSLRADRALLRDTEAALPLRRPNPLDDVDDETFTRLTRRALGHYGNLSKLVASPLTALPILGTRLAEHGLPDQPLERANELKSLLAERIAALKPRGDEDFGTSEEWRYYNSLYFPYVVGVRAYAQNATAAGLDPTARRAWQWLVTEVPQRSLHNWQNAAARVIAADLRDGLAVSGSTQDRPGSNR
ncbi:hypothetical protein MINS_38600 [Mycolicibacterium insubricum]|uniref:Uncharacterized protein n=1 Tax=Mycolicibacterium insubricum TaxID=444597 RepID=A0A1X0DMH0_9MYCO|nr:hypothetical protein [Mycolicibacterium insubricum]MCB9442041.1 hypothetical protein [Mycolicibacterium sp.]MCV7082369.1 hypothetical protein [Mycolicibacterium insubricum]ORA73040.1 hypothetical protein BST26_03090 [Mycolicibacterium insubricum]BBZ68431.1 hypothetical protein MINS_38600 [Mycolicibacterium insubricum]